MFGESIIFVNFVINLKTILSNSNMNKPFRHAVLFMLMAALSLWQGVSRAAMVEQCDVGWLTREKGLSGLSVNKIMSDHEGRMWIATSSGVNLFNGINASVIPIEAQKGSADTAQPFIFDICQSPADGSIYCSTLNAVYRLEPDGSSFRLLIPDVKSANLLCSNSSLYVSDPKGFRVYSHGSLSEESITGDRNVHCMALGGDESVWMLTSDALCHYLPSEKRIEHRDVRGVFPQGAAFSSIVFAGRRCYVGTNNYGLFTYDLRTGRAARVKGVGNVVTKLSSDNRGHVCVATDGSGAYLVDGRTGRILQHFSIDQHSQWQLPTNAVYHYLRDSKGNNWFGLYVNGLFYTYHQSPLFHIYHYGSFDSSGFEVRSFCIDGHRRLIGTNNGLYLIDEDAGIERHYEPSSLGGAHIINNIVRNGNRYYVGTYDGGVYAIDVSTLSVSPVTAISAVTGNASVFSMAVDSKRRLWTGTMTGVAIMDADGKTTWLTHDNSGLRSGNISTIAFDGRGNALIATSDGLSVMGAGHRFVPDSHYPKGFFHHEGRLKISVSRDGMVYFANNLGLFYSTTSMDRFGRLPLPSDVANERIAALLADGHGSLWFSTEEGLFRLNRDDYSLQHFGYGEGLRSYNITALGIKTAGDTLWAATSNGLVWLRLSDLKAWERSKEYRVVLYDVYNAGNPLSSELTNKLNTDHAISLSWNFVSDVLRGKALLNDYARPEGRIFEYRLSGEESWHLLRFGEDLKVEGLTMGKYSLCVRLAGTPGTETVFRITVYPSALFIIEVLMLALAIVFFVLWRNYHKNTKVMLHERDQIEDALVEIAHSEAMLSEQQEAVEESTGKYQQVKMSDKECADIVRRMRDYLEKSRAYTNPDLKRTDLAKVLNVPVAKLSYVFSMHLKENYYEFINRYRLEEFKRLIAEGAYRRFTLTALSERCGFKKTSFFTTFRKVEGMTPTEYLKRQNINIEL